MLIRFSHFFSKLLPLKSKNYYELLYWRLKKFKAQKFNNGHYSYFFTTHFNLTEDFYRDKNILDIGCGPRGTLEWIVNSKIKIGIDPLSHHYKRIFNSNHSMNYISGNSEFMPFADNSFDILSSFNSLDHVNDIDKTVTEAGRILKKGGLFLIITDTGHKPTVFEPQEFTWNITGRFEKYFNVLEEVHFEKPYPHKFYESLRRKIPFNHNDKKNRYGILSLKLCRR